jgi:Flp pilus assembly protein TadD
MSRRIGARVPVTVLAIVLMGLLVAGMAGLASAGTPTKRSDSPKVSARAEQHVAQGMTYVKMKDYENAIIEFTSAIELAPNYAVAYADRGIAYMQQRKFNKAGDDLLKAVALKPGDKSIHYNLTALYSLQGANDRAFDSLDKAMALGFSNYEALRNDPDLDGIRNEPEFQKVLEKHKVFIK